MKINFYFYQLFPPLHSYFKLPDGSCKLTETTVYNTFKNIAVFSESFEFFVSNIAEIPYYNIEVCEYAE